MSGPISNTCGNVVWDTEFVADKFKEIAGNMIDQTAKVAPKILTNQAVDTSTGGSKLAIDDIIPPAAKPIVNASIDATASALKPPLEKAVDEGSQIVKPYAKTLTFILIDLVKSVAKNVFGYIDCMSA